MSELQLLTGKITSLDRRRVRGAWGVAVLTHYVKVTTPTKTKENRVDTTITGNIAIFEVGDLLDVVGCYEDSNYGRQFKVIRADLSLPNTDAEMDRWFIEKLPHVGTVRVQELRDLAKERGLSLHEFLDTAKVSDLTEIDGINWDRAQLLLDTWSKTKKFHDQFKRLVDIGLTADEIRHLTRTDADITGIDTNPFVLFDERVVSLNRLGAILKKSYPDKENTPEHRARFVLHSIREAIEDTGSTAADVYEVLEHLRLRAPAATLDKLRDLAEQVPGIYEIFGTLIQPRSLAAAESTIADFVRSRT